MKKYCPSCGGATEYLAAEIPKFCAKCGQKLDLEVFSNTNTYNSNTYTETKPKKINRRRQEEEYEEEESSDSIDTDYDIKTARAGVYIDGEKEPTITFGELAAQQKTGDKGRIKPKVKKQSLQKFQEEFRQKAGSQRNSIEIE